MTRESIWERPVCPQVSPGFQTAGVTIPNGNCWGLTFGYDTWGNLLQSFTTGPLGCGEPMPLNVAATIKNQLSGYSYDAAGNMLNDGSHTYTYNAENQLLTAAGMTYTYDGDGKRVEKLSGTTVTKLYWYGGGSDPLDETDATGSSANAAFNEYFFFNGKRIARRDSSNNVSYYFADHLGTARVVTNSAGIILDDSDFYPFGGERTITSSSGNAYKFTGKERDSESGLDNFGARYNSSSMGRFMSPDWSAAPMGVPYADFGNPQSLNLYSYAKNNPITYVDRDGHCGEPLSFVACVVGGAAAAGYVVYKLHQWYKKREKAENEAFQKSLGCTASGAQCTEGETRSYDKERLNTYGEGAVQAITNTMPSATPSTEIKDVVIDELKDRAADKMVDSAKEKGKEQPGQPNQPEQPNPNQQPSTTPNIPPPPPPVPPPPPPCAFDKEKKC